MNTIKNEVRLVGNLGTEPEIRNLESGKKFCRFSLATNESYKNSKGEKVEQTEWHNVIAWESTAAFIEKYVKKGMQVLILGKLCSRSYEDKGGIKHYITEIKINEILLLTKASSTTTQQ